MTNGQIIVFGIILFIGGAVLGIAYEKMEKPKHVIALAMGFDETTQLWNRIRVDKEGKVICHKEQ